MFEFLFKYPATVFSKGQFVLLAAWPVWALGLAIVAVAVVLGWHMQRQRGFLTGVRPVAIWLLETLLAALVLFLLWHPAISIATLRPQQNIVSVLIDDSRSMSIKEDGKTRLEQAVAGLNNGVLEGLRKRFQVRLYHFGKEAQRIDKLEQLTGSATATRIGDGITQALADSSTLPLGAVVLLTDGADNSGGVDRDTIALIRQRQIPVHAVGFGKEKVDRDVEMSDVSLPARTLVDARLAADVTFRSFGYSGQKAKLAVRDGGKVLASQEVTLKSDGAPQTEQVQFNAGSSGAKSYQFSIEPLAGEENTANNAVTRLVNVEGSSRASSISRASRAGSSDSCAARSRTTAASSWYRLFGPRRTRSCSLAEPRSSRTVSRARRRICSTFRASSSGTCRRVTSPRRSRT